ncbi:MAG TPA: hypothetical protein VK308_10100, partial [Pyrinomonadaceae bacterium]|nr:hypothetical protein [Pyrinomonadaceae bacterium]
MSAIEKKQRFNFVRPQFIERMEAELLSNSAHKGDWISWLPDKLLLVAELNWHLAKLVQAIMDNDSSKVSEYAADIANYGMKADEIYGNQTEETMLKNLAPTVWERVGLVSDSKDCGGSNIAPSEEVLKRYNAIKNLVESETRTAAMVKNAADSHG